MIPHTLSYITEPFSLPRNFNLNLFIIPLRQVTKIITLSRSPSKKRQIFSPALEIALSLPCGLHWPLGIGRLAHVMQSETWQVFVHWALPSLATLWHPVTTVWGWMENEVEQKWTIPVVFPWPISLPSAKCESQVIPDHPAPASPDKKNHSNSWPVEWWTGKWLTLFKAIKFGGGLLYSKT